MAAFPEPVPRKDLFSRKDEAAWCEQYHLLRYVLHMSPMQIAQIDYGLDPDHPDAWMAFSWAHHLNAQFPRMNVRAMIDAGRRGRQVGWRTTWIAGLF